jgi:hypothetical protein
LLPQSKPCITVQPLAQAATRVYSHNLPGSSPAVLMSSTDSAVGAAEATKSGFKAPAAATEHRSETSRPKVQGLKGASSSRILPLQATADSLHLQQPSLPDSTSAPWLLNNLSAECCGTVLMLQTVAAPAHSTAIE